MISKLRKRDQHEPKPDGDASDVAPARSARPEHHDARQQQQRRELREP